VGHEPDLGGIISSILRCGVQLPLEMKKGCACCITVTETVPTIGGKLAWMVTLKQLRMLGK
jgi:phosphohistidine phosphatase SixA